MSSWIVSCMTDMVNNTAEILAIIREAQDRLSPLFGTEVKLSVSLRAKSFVDFSAREIVRHIALIVCRGMGVSYQDFTEVHGKHAKREVADSRVYTVSLVDEVMPGIGPSHLGRHMGDVSHCMVIHYRKTFKNLYGTNRKFTRQYEKIRAEVSRAYPYLFDDGTRELVLQGSR